LKNNNFLKYFWKFILKMVNMTYLTLQELHEYLQS